MKKSTVYIGIGSNLGDRRANIDRAMELIGLNKGLRLLAASSVYETDPIGGPRQGKFLNGVFKIETGLGPARLLDELKSIERRLGRKKGVKNGPRAIDLDILLFGNKKINKRRLKIPHPRMYEREFVLRGLRELTGESEP
jgi:2-amino-4-hydroxy-6-hydroxymethyldihydropteridine diphosphokinase